VRIIARQTVPKPHNVKFV